MPIVIFYRIRLLQTNDHEKLNVLQSLDKSTLEADPLDSKVRIQIAISLSLGSENSKESDSNFWSFGVNSTFY